MFKRIKSILDGNVTYDLARGREEAKTLKSSEFANSLIDNLDKFWRNSYEESYGSWSR